MKLLQQGNSYNTPIQTWLCVNEDEISRIPAEAPAGSIAVFLGENGLTGKMKQESGDWEEI